MQRITPVIGPAFQTMKDELRKVFLPALFKGSMSQIPGRAVTGIPVKQDGIAIPNPNHTAGANWTASCVITGHLVVAIRGTAEFRGGSCPPDWRGQIQDPLAACRDRGYSTGGGPGRCVYGGRPLDEKDHADVGVAIGAPLHRQWDRVRGAGVERLPLPALRHRST